jgi:serine/threonine-protein kinase
MSQSTTNLSARLLREHLDQDLAVREASIARFMCFMTGISAVAALALAGNIGWPLALSIAGFVGALFFYYLVTFRLLRKGWFPPALQWLNTAVMVSIPAVVFTFDLKHQGASYALTTPPLVAWGALIVVSSLRAGRALAYAGAALAALEYYGLYFFLARPLLPSDVLTTLTPPLMAVRALFLFCYGPLTATVAGHLMRKAEEALRAVRERDVMGKYFLHERVGTGGMAEVFRATYSPEGGFEKVVAVKRVLPAFSEDRDFLTMFRREAELCSMLNHPNIVQVFDLGRHNGTVFLAMEYVEGISLGVLLERFPGHQLPPSAVAYLGAELGGALEYVHSRRGATGEPLGLVHRDLNPPNILVSSIGEVKLSDFGIARAGVHASLTQHGNVRGKAGYLAPEQVQGLPFDGRADLFALGLTLHEALTGAPALSGGTELELLQASVSGGVPPPSRLAMGIPPELDAAVMGLLEVDPARRTASGAQLQRQLMALSGDAAPYPNGREALVAAVRACMKSKGKAPEPLPEVDDLRLTAGPGGIDPHPSPLPEGEGTSTGSTRVGSAVSGQVPVAPVPSRAPVTAVQAPLAVPEPTPVVVAEQAPPVVVAEAPVPAEPRQGPTGTQVFGVRKNAG